MTVYSLHFSKIKSSLMRKRQEKRWLGEQFQLLWWSQFVQDRSCTANLQSVGTYFGTFFPPCLVIFIHKNSFTACLKNDSDCSYCLHVGWQLCSELMGLLLLQPQDKYVRRTWLILRRISITSSLLTVFALFFSFFLYQAKQSFLPS